MPASRSPRRDAKPRKTRPSIGPWILIGVSAVFAVVVVALPASMATHFLPPSIRADDFSGSLWHGSAGKITLNSRDIGALEWRIHLTALLSLGVAADLHWVKQGFVIDGAANIDRHGFSAQEVKGGGPIEDLQDFGIAAGWHGNAQLQFSEVSGDYKKLSSAVGAINVSDLTSAQFAAGTNLGGYELRLAAGAVSADGNVNATLSDTGGPVEIRSQVTFSPAQRTGMLSGTLKERDSASQSLRSQLDNLSQLRARDPQGRIPVDLEFTY